MFSSITSGDVGNGKPAPQTTMSRRSGGGIEPRDPNAIAGVVTEDPDGTTEALPGEAQAGSLSSPVGVESASTALLNVSARLVRGGPTHSMGSLPPVQGARAMPVDNVRQPSTGSGVQLGQQLLKANLERLIKESTERLKKAGVEPITQDILNDGYKFGDLIIADSKRVEVLCKTQKIHTGPPGASDHVDHKWTDFTLVPSHIIDMVVLIARDTRELSKVLRYAFQQYQIVVKSVTSKYHAEVADVIIEQANVNHAAEAYGAYTAIMGMEKDISFISTERGMAIGNWVSELDVKVKELDIIAALAEDLYAKSKIVSSAKAGRANMLVTSKRVPPKGRPFDVEFD